MCCRFNSSGVGSNCYCFCAIFLVIRNEILEKYLFVGKKKCLNVRQKLGTGTLTLSLSHYLIHSLSTCWTTFVFMSRLKSHSLTFTLFHSHTLTRSYSFSLSFTLSRHAEQLLFSSLCSKVAVYSRKMQCFFLTSSSSSPSPVTLDVIELVPS